MTQRKIKTPDMNEFAYLDDEERKLINSIENTDEWVSIPNFKTEKKRVEKAAAFTLKRLKNKNINIRISQSDIDQIKKRAAGNGLPYQTLITTILHQFATGKLKIEL